MEALLLRFEAPLMSFGGVMVDQHNITDRFPGLALLTGLLGNALGYTHAGHAALDALQARLRFAARWDRSPQPVCDYQTVALGQSFLQDTGWTTRGISEGRGGASSEGTHIRFRHYWADGVLTMAFSLADAAGPDLDALATALPCPARPLFIGRKTCLPSAPLLRGRRTGASLRGILAAEPRDVAADSTASKLEACWPHEEGAFAPGDELIEISDRRDWRHQLHTGQRRQWRGWLEVPA